MRNDNHIVVDLNKCQYASFYYQTKHCQHIRRKKPHHPTVNGDEFDPKEKILGKNKTTLEFAQERGLVDVWEPVLRLQLTANHSLCYTGDKAKSIWKEWNRRIFKKK